jgi:GDPmannose 4,6-dehydratase
MALQQPKPDDFVFATGEMHTVGEFIEKAFARAGIDDWSTYIEIDRFMMRPLEVEKLCGDPSKAKAVLGWEPKVKFEQLVKIMVEHDCRLLGVYDKLPPMERKDG